MRAKQRQVGLLSSRNLYVGPKTSFWRYSVLMILTLYFLCDSELSYLIVKDLSVVRLLPDSLTPFLECARPFPAVRLVKSARVGSACCMHALCILTMCLCRAQLCILPCWNVQSELGRQQAVLQLQSWHLLGCWGWELYQLRGQCVLLSRRQLMHWLQSRLL